MTEPTIEDLEAKAVKLSKLLLAEGLWMATAESCTGGWIAQTATAIAGSSSWFDRGFVTYSNRAKMEMLGVQESSLEQHGAVSAPVAAEMAEGAVARAGVDLGVAVTGIAGPDGGTAEKPVGTVWFGCCRAGVATRTQVVVFSGNRHAVRAQTVALAFDFLMEMAGTTLA